PRERARARGRPAHRREADRAEAERYIERGAGDPRERACAARAGRPDSLPARTHAAGSRRSGARLAPPCRFARARTDCRGAREARSEGRSMTTRVALATLALLLAGCSTILDPRPDRSRFYTLTPLAEGDAEAGAPLRGGVVGLGPIELPAYLDRREVVTRVEPNRLTYSGVARWAGGVRTSFAQVLARDLGVLLGTDQVLTFPWFIALQPQYVVEMRVTRFERGSDDGAELAAAWILR